MPSKGKQTFPDGVTTSVKTTTYSRAVMAVAGMSSREKANIFLPRSFREAQEAVMALLVDMDAYRRILAAVLLQVQSQLALTVCV